MRVLVFIFVVLFSVNVSAFVNCFGKINNVYLSKSGHLVVHTTWKNGYAAVCSMTETWKGVSAEVCKGWLSIAQTAQVSKMETVMQYGSLNACSDVQDYTSAEAPNYLMLYGL